MSQPALRSHHNQQPLFILLLTVFMSKNKNQKMFKKLHLNIVWPKLLRRQIIKNPFIRNRCRKRVRNSLLVWTRNSVLRVKTLKPVFCCKIPLKNIQYVYCIQKCILHGLQSLRTNLRWSKLHCTYVRAGRGGATAGRQYHGRRDAAPRRDIVHSRSDNRPRRLP